VRAHGVVAGGGDRHVQLTLEQLVFEALPAVEGHRPQLDAVLAEEAPLHRHRQRGDIEARQVAEAHGFQIRLACRHQRRDPLLALLEAPLLLQEADQLTAQVVVVGVIHYLEPLARPRQGHLQDLADAGLRAVGEAHHPIGEQQRFIHVVGHHHGGHAGLLADLHQLLLQIAAGEGIQGAEGFIQEQQPGANRQGAGDRHPLLHAAGEFTGVLVGGMAETHELNALFDALALLGRRGAAHHIVHRQGDVLAHGLPGQQRVVLEHHHPLGSRIGHLASIHQDAATAGLGEASHQVEQGGFPATRVADQRDEFPFADAEVDVFESHITAAIIKGKNLGDVVNREKGNGHRQLPPLATRLPT